MKTLLQYYHFFLLFFCANSIPPVHSLCIKNQQLLLLQLRKSLTFCNDSLRYSSTVSSTEIISSWNSSTDCCSWIGVTCSTSGHVVGLDISNDKSISCGIDNSSSLFKLQHLQSLNLARNGLGIPGDSGIPSSIGKLTNLRYLNLSYTSYSGIPIEISRLTKLVVLDFSGLYEIGIYNLSMLFQNFTELTELYLNEASVFDTHWSQAISSSLPNLRVLSLSECQLTGPIDQSLSKLQSLSVIRLDYNDIDSPVPAFFANFSKLTSLSLSNCGLLGTFPKEIFQIPSLQAIDLSDNGELHGSLPEFPKNGSLRSLVLSSTIFSGPLPDSIGNLKNLSKIDLSQCSFTGSIPKSMGNLTQLVHLDLSANMFNGPISSIRWGNLVNLVYLWLKENILEGSIPSSLFSLPLLPELLLSYNQFSGQLCEFSNVSSNLLTELDLRFNNLEGPFPVSIFNLRGLESLRVSSNNFSAFPFNGPEQLTNLTRIDLSHNNLLILYNGTNSSHSSFPQIEYLDFSFNKLKKIPGFLRYQSNLAYLDLSENQIQGKIPHWIWSFTGLYSLNLCCNSLVTLELPSFNSTVSLLDVHSNQLQGKLPLMFTPNAVSLDYSKNHFSSGIPTDIGDFLTSNTTILSLSSNDLHGPIPVSICNGGLQVLDLSNNSFSGMIPQCLYAMNTLEVLNLGRNNFTGTISDKFSTNCTLKTLDLSRNMVQGKIPKSLVYCTMLAVLNLGSNQITDAFPHFLKEISTLRVLVLRSNRFYGSIECPKTNGTWSMLQIIDLADNNISGEIAVNCVATWTAMMADKDPSSELNHPQPQVLRSTYYQDTVTVTSKGLEVELVKILTVYTSVDFSGNNFSGSIPKEMGELKSLYILNLSRNALTSEIPSSLGNLLQVESLDLSNNKLSGQIPAQLAKLTFLSVLDLSNNQLVGMIPTGGQFSTFPKASFTGNKGLWGPPLTVDNKTGFSPPPTLNGSLPSSGHHEIDWDLISAEIGFTFGFGVAIASLVFCKRWSKWYYKVMYNIILKIFPQLEERFGHHQRHAHINQRWRH